MVDWWGRWTAEKDYNSYPKRNWCAMDYVANAIICDGYKPNTSIENVAEMAVAHFEYEDEFTIEDCLRFVEDSGGWQEFDFGC